MKQLVFFLHPVVRCFLFCLLGLLFACSPKEDVPSEFPDEDEMAEILADIYIIESTLSHGGEGSSSPASDEEIPAYYKEVLDEYDLTSQQFDTIREWYAAHPYHYQEVYEKTIVLLNREEAEFRRQINEEEQLDTVPVINDLWSYQRNIAVSPEDTSDRRLPFQFEVDSLESGEIRLSALYKFLREDLTREGQITMITLYADSTADTISRQLEKTFKEKSISILQPLDSVSPVTNISGFLFEHDTSMVTAIEFSDIQLEHLSEEDYKPDTLLRKDDLPELEMRNGNVQ